MKNSEKNSRKSNFLFYLTFFALIFLLTFGGVYLYYTAEDRKLAQQITLIKEAKAQYKEISNNDIVSINERNIQEKEDIVKKLKHNVNLKPKTRRKIKELLKELAQDINPDIDQETLEKKSKEERKEIIRKVLTTKLKFSKFKSVVKEVTGEKFDEINYLKEQNKWLENFFPESGQSEEDEEVTAKLNEFLKHFYGKFIREKNLPFPKIVQLVKDKTGKYYPFDEPSSAEIEQEINALKLRHTNDFNKEMRPNFVGFKGWLSDANREKGTTTAGLTTTYNLVTLTIADVEPRFEIKISHDIKIELHKAFPFSRKGKEYNLWLVETDKGTNNIFVGWNSLIETIAHELAHAVINSTKVYYRAAKKKEEDGEIREEGGHGILHRTYTQELYKMIKEDAKYRELKDFWFKNK